MPRHPPYALTNLTTDTRKRCSRPLCSSQTTNEPNPTPHTHEYPYTRTHSLMGGTGPPPKQHTPNPAADTPKSSRPPGRPVPSGPNSVRPTTRATQDPDNEDDHHPTPPTSFLPASGRTRQSVQRDGRSRRSTHERPHPTHKAGNVAT